MTSAPFIVVEGERRVCTIRFCEVKGSTAIAEWLDPENWAEIMNGVFLIWREHLVEGWPNERVPCRKHRAAVAATGGV